MNKYLLIACVVLSTFISNAQFIENKGQVADLNQDFHPEVKYYSNIGKASVFFEKDRVVFNFREEDKFDFSKPPYRDNADLRDSIKATLGSTFHRLDLKLIESNDDAEVRGENKQESYINFFLNKRENIKNVGKFDVVRYKNVYPNIDLLFHFSSEGLKYDFILRQGAIIEDIKFKYQGAENVDIDENGQLTINTTFGKLNENIPLSFVDGNKKAKVDVEYIINEKDEIQFKLKRDVQFEELTIDPFLTWGTYFEGSVGDNELDYYASIADDQGNLFVEGWINDDANDYPTVDPGGTAYFQNYVSNNLYIAKFDANRSLVWATYYGGSTSIDWSTATDPLAIEGTTLHFVGSQLSTDAPLLDGGGYYAGAPNSDPYWLRLNKNTGELLHATSFPSHTSSQPSIATSSSGLVAIIQQTYDFGNPEIVNRPGAYNQATNGGYQDMHIMLFNSSYNLIWGTFLGGPNTTDNFHVTFDSNDNIFFVGEANNTFSPTAANTHLQSYPGSYYQSTYSAAMGNHDLIIGKFNASGALVWHTLYGGDASDGLKSQMGNGSRVIIDPDTEDLVVIGGTNSSNFPLQNLTGAYNLSTPPANNDPSGGSYWDFNSFIVKFNNDGAHQWGTYWGDDPGGDLLYDGVFTGCDKFIVSSRSTDHTTIPLPYGYNQPTGGQAFLMQFDGNFAAEWSSYIGDGGEPTIAHSSFDNRLYLGASTYSTGLTMTDPGNGAYYDDTNDDSGTGSTSPAFSIYELNLNPQITGSSTACIGQTISLSGSGTAAGSNPWTSSNTGVATVDNSGNVTGLSTGSTTITYTDNVGCSATFSVTVESVPTANASAVNPTICEGDDIELTANTVSGATYSWTGPNGFTSSNEDPTINNATVSEAGTYSLEITSGSCSSTSSDITITVNEPPVLNITGTDISCFGENDGEATVSATGNDPFSYSWSPSGGSAATATGLSEDNYTVTVTDDNNCVSTESVTINEPSEIVLTTSTVETQCTVDDGSATVSATGGTGNYTYLWTPTNQTTATATGLGAGSYDVEVTDDSNCSVSETVTVNAINGPTVSIINVTDVNCPGDSTGSAEADVSGGTPGYSYNWSPSGQSTAVANNLAAGTYSLEVTDDAGCVGAANVTIDEPAPFDVSATVNDADCGQSNGDIIVTASGANGNLSYSWAPISENSNSLLNVSGGTYTLTITDDQMCTFDTSFVVNATGGLSAVVTPDSATIDSGDLVNINTTVDPNISGENYSWTPATDLSCSDCPNPVASPDETTTYIVTIQTDDGCSETDTVFIKMDDDNPCGKVFVPNMFSPNGDNKNDELCVYGGCLKSFEMYIYNRWGEVVYQSTDPEMCWDGSYKNEKLNTGVFVYKLLYLDKNEEQQKLSGNIQLLR